MRWQEQVSFAEAPFEIIDGDRGKNYPKQSEFSESGHCLFLSAANVTKTGFDFTACQFIDLARDAALNKGKLQREDIVLTTRGTIGNTAYYNDAVSFENLRINSGMVILRCDRSKLIPAYLYHFVRSPDFFSQVNSLRSGVAQPQLPIRDMRQIKLPLPPFSVQQRIASILSAYDDLIENSQRRIKILESMARGLYREWFVHFRFPGHENTRIVDGLPEGWRRGLLEEIAEFKLGKMLDQDKNRGDLLPYLANINVRWGEFDLRDLRRMRFEADELETYGLKYGDIVMCEGGEPGRCAIWKEQLPGMMLQKAIHRIRCRKNMDHNYLYHSLRHFGQSGHLATFFTGSTIKHLPREKLAKLSIVVPPTPLLNNFRDPMISMEGQVYNLQCQIQNLRRTRDLLLPRLLSGQVDLKGV